MDGRTISMQLAALVQVHSSLNSFYNSEQSAQKDQAANLHRVSPKDPNSDLIVVLCKTQRQLLALNNQVTAISVTKEEGVGNMESLKPQNQVLWTVSPECVRGHSEPPRPSDL